MIYRKMGRTGLMVSEISLGTEYLWHEPKETVAAVMDEAMDRGVNYIDLFMPSPEVRDNFGFALKGRRDKMMVAGHLGSALRNDQYFRSRDNKESLQFFEDYLHRLQTDYIDVLMLHFVDEEDDYEKVFDPDGLLGIAMRLKEQGKARFIGLSSHRVPVSLKAVNSGVIDVLMFPVNPAFDSLPGDTILEALWQEKTYQKTSEENGQLRMERKELYHACASQGVAIAAMKPYGAGWLLWKENPSSIALTPVQCLHYALSQPGVCTVVPGCKNVEQMKAALSYLDSSDEEKDFSIIGQSSRWNLSGKCMYCNHCLPCPVGINIGLTTRMADTAEYSWNDSLLDEYNALGVKASQCIQCEACMKQCPFGIDVIGNMERAARLLENNIGR